jgi:threonine dehydrogenase-like Zn-dependent dehydrogenase
VKQVNVHGPGDVRVDEAPQPEAGPRDAVVKVAACGICGSDLRYVRLGGLAGPMPTPMPLGHELSGVIETVGGEVSEWQPGDRVVLNPTAGQKMIGNGGPEGGFTPRLLVREVADGNLFPVPAGLSMDRAALAEPLAVGMNAVNQSGAQPGEKVVIFGAGPIGLAAIATLHDRGVRDLIAVDLSARRLDIARKLGAKETIDASREDPWPRIRRVHGESPVLGAPMAGTHVYIEASGAAPVIPQIIQQARGGARVAVVALHEERPVNFLLVMMKQLTIRGAMEYPDDYNDAIGLLARRDLSAMISHRFPLERFADAFAVANDPQAGGKVLIEMV